MTTRLESLAGPVATAAHAVSTAVRLQDVGVRFRVPDEKIPSLKEYLVKLLTRSLRYRELWALRLVDLEVSSGEMFGVVGRNGAGKSTLLKVIARVLRPTSGRVIVHGRVAPLLELGAGFHVDLTGEENIYLNGTLLGYGNRQIDEQFDKVVEFAELGEFIHLPIRKYSTGMIARLGFSVATMFRPDILLLDEVLAVGDFRFQEKCLARIRSFCQQGTTVILVSHALETVQQHCPRAAWIEHGRIAALGPSREVLDRYRSVLTRE